MANLNLECFLFKEPLSLIIYFKSDLEVFKLWPPFHCYSLYTPIICHHHGTVKDPLDISAHMVQSRDILKTT